MTTSLPSVPPEISAAGGANARAACHPPGAAATGATTFDAIFAAQPAGEANAIQRTPGATPPSATMRPMLSPRGAVGVVEHPRVRATDASGGSEQICPTPTRTETEAALALLAPLWLASEALPQNLPNAAPLPATNEMRFAADAVMPKADDVAGPMTANAALVVPAMATPALAAPAAAGRSAPGEGNGVGASDASGAKPGRGSAKVLPPTLSRAVMAIAGHAPVELSTLDSRPLAGVAATLVERWSAERDGAKRGGPMRASEAPATLARERAPAISTSSLTALPLAGREGVAPLRASLTFSDGAVVSAEVEAPKVFGGLRRDVVSSVAGAQANLGEGVSAATLRFADRAPELPANSAVSGASERGETSARSLRGEKNSVSTRGAAVTIAATEAGIAIAQERAVMTDAVSIPPVAVSSAVVAMRDPAAVPLAGGVANAKSAEADAALAHRAVEAVEAVVDAQVVSRLQPVPSVALRFRVGEQDLAVRIELRAGEVHTEFRTDSPELRQAVAQEWRAMTTRTDVPARMLEPVFTNSAEGGPTNGQSFGQSQHQHSQQQQAQQHALLREVPAEFFGRVGRRFPAAATESAVVPVAPATSSTSARRLSAVA